MSMNMRPEPQKRSITDTPKTATGQGVWLQCEHTDTHH